MNIFILDNDPTLSAKYHCDKHVVKMILESAQMLSTAIYLQAGDTTGLYSPTHKTHPCTQWAAETRSNFIYLGDLGIALCNEYTLRYGKLHKTEDIIRLAISRSHEIPEGPLTPFAQCMPPQYQGLDAVEAYRNYYVYEKSRFAKWEYSETPDWYLSKLYEGDNYDRTGI